MNLTSLLNALPGAVAQGLIWGIMAIGVYITYKVLDQAVISDAQGKIIHNLAQQDMVALRCVMRLGWQLPNPVTQIGSSSGYPFAVLTPSA